MGSTGSDGRGDSSGDEMNTPKIKQEITRQVGRLVRQSRFAGCCGVSAVELQGLSAQHAMSVARARPGRAVIIVL